MKRVALMILLFVLSIGFVPPRYASAANIDVYLVYSLKEKALKVAVEKQLPPNLAIKSYNADLLAIADYSGKQKVIAKLSRATVVTLIGRKATTLLRDTSLKNSVTISEETIDADIEKLLKELEE